MGLHTFQATGKVMAEKAKCHHLAESLPVVGRVEVSSGLAHCHSLQVHSSVSLIILHTYTVCVPGSPPHQSLKNCPL